MDNILTMPDKASGIILYDYKIPAPGVKKKILYHFSDIHLAYTDPTTVGKQVMNYENWVAGWPGFSKVHNEPYDEIQMKEPAAHLAQLLELSGNGDAIAMTGDICDKVNDTNLGVLNAALKKVHTPCMLVCGNHDMAHEIPDGYLFSQMKEPVQVTDLGDLLLVGLDNASRQITPQQNEHLQQLLTQDKPMVIIMHIPIMTEDNYEKLIICGDYFRLNHPDANADTLAFIELLKANAGKILAVLAGHLHFHIESTIAPGLPQFVTSQGVLGNINRYEIGE